MESKYNGYIKKEYLKKKKHKLSKIIQESGKVGAKTGGGKMID